MLSTLLYIIDGMLLSVPGTKKRRSNGISLRMHGHDVGMSVGLGATAKTAACEQQHMHAACRIRSWCPSSLSTKCKQASDPWGCMGLPRPRSTGGAEWLMAGARCSQVVAWHTVHIP